MLFWLIPLVIGFVLLAVFLYFRVREERVTAVIIKGFASLMFILTALVAWLTSKHASSTYGVFVLLGLFFGLLGDILLDLKFIILKKELMYTILGFFAFAIGHVFYATGLFIHFYDFNSNILYLIIPIIIAILLTVVTVLMEKFSPIRYGKMKPYVIFYGFILFFTTSIYMSTTFQHSWNVTTIAIIAVSLLFFMLSDLILNNTYFAKGFSTPIFIITNHALYYVAQFAIAASLFFLV